MNQRNRAITGGPAAGGQSSSAKKVYARSVKTTYDPSMKAKTDQTIFFSDDDLEGIQTPHDDALVVTLTIANYKVRRILVSSGSLANILYYNAFEKMKISQDRLKPVNSLLYGYIGDAVTVEGSIELPVMAGTAPRQSTVMINFLIVKLPSVRNAILGRSGQNALNAVVSICHLKIKFPTDNGVGEVRGDQTVALCDRPEGEEQVKEVFILEIQDMRHI